MLIGLNSPLGLQFVALFHEPFCCKFDQLYTAKSGKGEFKKLKKENQALQMNLVFYKLRHFFITWQAMTHFFSSKLWFAVALLCFLLKCYREELKCWLSRCLTSPFNNCILGLYFPPLMCQLRPLPVYTITRAHFSGLSVYGLYVNVLISI